MRAGGRWFLAGEINRMSLGSNLAGPYQITDDCHQSGRKHRRRDYDCPAREVCADVHANPRRSRAASELRPNPQAVWSGLVIPFQFSGPGIQRENAMEIFLTCHSMRDKSLMIKMVRLAFLLFWCPLVTWTATLNVDTSGVRSGAVAVRSTATALEIEWKDDRSRPCSAAFSLTEAIPTITA